MNIFEHLLLPVHVTIFVPGIPKPGGSKTATLIRRKGGAIVMKNGRPLIATRDACKGNAEWKQNVAFFARQAYEGPLLTCPLRVVMWFYMPRPKGHYRTNGTLKPSAPIGPAVKPDVLKLARSTEDALTGIIWTDDAGNLDVELHKRYADGQTKPGALITITEAAHGQDQH